MYSAEVIIEAARETPVLGIGAAGHAFPLGAAVGPVDHLWSAATGDA
jgi:hypothetical protein